MPEYINSICLPIGIGINCLIFCVMIYYQNKSIKTEIREIKNLLQKIEEEYREHSKAVRRPEEELPGDQPNHPIDC